MLPLCVYTEKESFRDKQHPKNMTSKGDLVSGNPYNHCEIFQDYQQNLI